MEVSNIGTSSFAISYNFYDETHETEIFMLVDGDNILEFENRGKVLTTRWNLDELVLWLRDFLSHLEEDPYPVEITGEYASIKDENARDFDSDNDEEFDAYYDKLDAWNSKHRWHPASNGAILADLYFEVVGESIEISWNNCNSDKGVIFKYCLGGIRVPKEQFVSAIDTFLKEYANHWFKL